MKITKEMLAWLRDKTTSPVSMCFGSATITPDELRALLDERKALREALGDLVEWVEGMPDEALRAEGTRSALALGEDEE